MNGDIRFRMIVCVESGWLPSNVWVLGSNETFSISSWADLKLLDLKAASKDLYWVPNVLTAEAAATVAQSVKVPKLRSVKEMQ